VAVELPKGRIWRFGPFELHHGTGELFRRGKRVPLQGQPARALVLLVESAGAIVTREELRARIWPDATHGDFEASLNTAVKKIRQALADSPQEPHFVQTVHRLGYRFIARVEQIDVAEGLAESASAAPAATPRISATAASAAPAPAPEAAVIALEPPGKRAPLLAWGGAAVAVVTFLAIALYYALPLPMDRPAIVRYRQLTHDGYGKLEPFSSGSDGVLVTDGSRIYFSAISGTQVMVAEVASEGGETVRLNEDSANPLVVKAISPDNAQLLAADFYRVSPDLPLRILPLPGGSPRTLANLVAHDGAWSPDGRTIAYAAGQEIREATSDGSRPRTLLRSSGIPFWPRWSPDGSRLRFTVRDENGGTSIWEAGANGGNPHPLFAGSRDTSGECCGNWSPDGQYFVFQATHLGRTSLWAVRERGGWLPRHSAPVELTAGPLSMSAPVFSRNGREIYAIGTQRRGELVRYNGQTGEFDIFLSGLSADHVEFSPDGQWIAYSTYPEGVIWRSRVNGTDRLQLSDPSITAWFPRWSPDGKRIAFTGTSPGKPVKIYLVPANGGAAELLAPGPDTEIDPNWSPDGNSLMFATAPGQSAASGPPRIETMDLQNRRVTLLPGSDGLNAPRWSPDGRYVVATALSQNQWRNPGVVIFDFHTGAWTGFENDPIDNKWWSADGRYFYFDRYVNNDPAIFRIRMSDRRIERVAGLRDVRRSPGVMGWWMGLTPDGSPMILRDTSIQEIYALDWR
jgi:Tol biopolymer transport system component/DNA-binding winged helix-turn-helix (wHTH) protein